MTQDRNVQAPYIIGGPGPLASLFQAPVSIFVAEREVFVADDEAHRIVVLDFDGRFVRSMGSFGRQLGQVAYVDAVFVRGETIYVADAGNNRVQIWDAAGRALS